MVESAGSGSAAKQTLDSSNGQVNGCPAAPFNINRIGAESSACNKNKLVQLHQAQNQDAAVVDAEFLKQIAEAEIVEQQHQHNIN